VYGARAGLEDGADRAPHDHGRVGRAQVERRQPPGDVEVIAGRAVLPQRRHRRGGALEDERVAGEPDAAGPQVLGEQLAVGIRRPRGREPDLPAEPGQRDRRVGGAAAGVVALAPVAAADDVDERLAHHQRDRLHGRGLPPGRP
jgi:hypothetical protein